METAPPRRASFLDEEEYGLASLADTEAGFSGSHHLHHHQSAVLNRSVLCFSKRSSLRSIVSMSGPGSPRSVRFADGRVEDFREPHFLDACFLCRKPLGDNRDIFMYRGDTPFCSEECRQEQIEMDEAKEKNKNLSSMKAMRNKDQKKSSSSRSSSGQTYSFRTGTVAAG